MVKNIFSLLLVVFLSQGASGQITPPFNPENPSPLSCPGFQWELCSVSPSARPPERYGRVSFKSNFIPPPPGDQVNVLVFNSNFQPAPGIFSNNVVVHITNSQTAAPCTGGNVYGFLSGTLPPPGDYKVVFLSPGNACSDTVGFTIPNYPCEKFIDSFQVVPPTSPTAKDARIRIFGTDMASGYLYRNGSLIPNPISFDCGLFNCIPIPLPGDNPPPPFSGCDFWAASNTAHVCELESGLYQVRVWNRFVQGCADSILVSIGGQVDTIARPLASLAPGNYSGNQQISLSSSSPGAAIYFTTNGNIPRIDFPNSFTKLYTGPFVLTQNAVVRAQAFAGGKKSAVSRFEYTITNPQIASNPTLSLPGNTYSGIQQLTLATTTPGATIYFTTNGNVPRFDFPNSFTKVYSGPIQVNRSMTVRALAAAPGFVNSGVTVANYIITDVQTVAAPTFSPGPGTYSSSQGVQISCATPGAQIYFTTNGMTPRPGLFAARLYSTPLVVSNSLQLKARAFLSGAIESAVSVGNYTIGALRLATGNEEGEAFYLLDNDNSLTTEPDIQAFPNPSSSGLFEVSGLKSEYQIRLINNLGQETSFHSSSLENGRFLLNLENVPKGIYFFQVNQAGSQKILRLVK